jgi:DNA polymerase I-like protein with 3'-5' exonuclease and polymerase domains/uracil-DNA glycosylase
VRTLPLYTDRRIAVETVGPRDPDPDCALCSLSVGAKTVCVPPHGEPGGVLLVTDKITEECEALGKPMYGGAANMVRRFVEAAAAEHDLPVAVVSAVSCRGKAETVNVFACRGYVRGAIERLRPQRIFAFGAAAYASLTGRAPPSAHVRRGYAMMSDGTPVFLMLSPLAVAQNKHVRAMLQRDVEWALTATPRPPPWDGLARIVTTPADAQQAAAALAGAPWVYLDLEWAGGKWDPEYFEVLSVGVCRPGSDDVWVWSLREVGAADREAVLAPLRAIVEDPEIGKAAHSGTGDVQALKCGLGMQLRNYRADSFFWRQQQESDVFARLDYQQELVGMGGGKEPIEQVKAKAKARVNSARRQDQRQLGLYAEDPAISAARRNPHLPDETFSYALAYELDPDLFLQYNALDVVSGCRLVETLETWIDSSGYGRYFWDEILQPMIEVGFPRMEEAGMLIDPEAFESAREFFEERTRTIEAQLARYGLASPTSPQQVSAFLFGKLGLDDRDAPSTDAKVLHRLERKHQAVKLILDHREATTALTRYCTLPGWARRKTNRIHASFLPMGTRTGRPSSRDPNLLNLPSRSKAVKQAIKRGFIAPHGHQLVVLDYSQAELRVAALMSGDAKMTQVFKDGRDLHWETARKISKLVWGLAPDQLDPETHRIPTKTFVFSLLYGKGDKTLARELKLPLTTVKKMRAAVLGEYTRLAEWLEEQKAYTRKHGVAWTVWNGQRAVCRQMSAIASPLDGVRSNAENGAINSPVQGSAALYVFAAIPRLLRWIDDARVPAQLTNTVYDSIVAEVRDDWVERFVAKAWSVMTGLPSGDVPMKADATVGPTWADQMPFEKWVAAYGSARDEGVENG